MYVGGIDPGSRDLQGVLGVSREEGHQADLIGDVGHDLTLQCPVPARFPIASLASRGRHVGRRHRHRDLRERRQRRSPSATRCTGPVPRTSSWPTPGWTTRGPATSPLQGRSARRASRHDHTGPGSGHPRRGWAVSHRDPDHRRGHQRRYRTDRRDDSDDARAGDQLIERDLPRASHLGHLRCRQPCLRPVLGHRQRPHDDHGGRVRREPDLRDQATQHRGQRGCRVRAGGRCRRDRIGTAERRRERYRHSVHQVRAARVLDIKGAPARRSGRSQRSLGTAARIEPGRGVLLQVRRSAREDDRPVSRRAREHATDRRAQRLQHRRPSERRRGQRCPG